jgi:uncharacterized Tic20 family protein
MSEQPLPNDKERLWATLAHLLAVVSAYVALGFIAPFIVLLVFGERSKFVRLHAVEALNFNLSWALYTVVAVILAIVLIGIPILILLAIAYVILVIIAATKARNGEPFYYPATIHFVS